MLLWDEIHLIVSLFLNSYCVAKSKIFFSWSEEFSYSNSYTLKVMGKSKIPSKTIICFSRDGGLAKNTDQANVIQKKIGETLQNLYCERFPIVGKIMFSPSGITIYKTTFKTWEIRCALIQKALVKVLAKEGIEAIFTNGY